LKFHFQVIPRLLREGMSQQLKNEKKATVPKGFCFSKLRHKELRII